MFLNYTILYLGYSFSDPYLNELRSEALAILGGSETWPVAYAVMNDVSLPARDHYASVEGIRVLPYDTKEVGHAGFDHWLDALHQATNPVVGFGALLKGKRILWVDRNPQNNQYLADEFFATAAEQAKNAGCEIDVVPNAEQAFERLEPEPGKSQYDLLITHWGYEVGQTATAQKLLAHIRKEDVSVPVLIYSRYDRADERKPLALGLGAQGYYHTTEGLLKAIEHLLRPGVETG